MSDNEMNRTAWGKTDGRDGFTHHLAHHSMDVAAVFQRLLDLPVFRARAEKAAEMTLSRQTVARLGAIVFVHDIGKLHPAFQAKGWREGLWTWPERGHVPESLHFLELSWKLPDHPFREVLQSLAQWGAGVEPLLVASLSHHGRPIEQGSQATAADWPTLPHYDWRGQAATMADAVRRWFREAFTDGGNLPEHPRFVHFFAGLTALADWVGSDKRFFEFIGTFDQDYEEVARDRAARAVTELGLDVARLPRRPSLSFTELTGYAQPNPAQDVVGGMSDEERLVILEAETGSGKTEAALWRFAQLFAAGRVEGLYFAVPTRAAARQLHGRAHKAMKRVFGDHGPEAILAVPGLLAAGEATGRRLPGWQFLWEDRSGSVPARWAAEHATRFLAATVAVGTVDQAMLAGLKIKHAHLRGSALSRSLLVIDEVHASDAYMTGVLAQLLDAHLALGGYAMLMSATLGSRARVRWTGETQPGFSDAVATSYPAVWTGGKPEPRWTEGIRCSKEVRLELDDMAPDRAAELALKAANQGARVLVIRNTVTKAVETWEAVQELGGTARLLQAADGPALHHGRFAAEDRVLLDRAVEEVLAPNPQRPRMGVVVIGTQTLEQSLDIDADYLITDLCPVDVLLQRVGRLHRHQLPRPEGFEDAKTVVLTPADGLDRLTAPDFENGLGGWEAQGEFQGIYRDLPVVELTRRLIEHEPLWNIPEMNRRLVEAATHPERTAALILEKGEAWIAYERTLGGVEAAERALARLRWLDREHRYEDSPFPPGDERIMTRLGEDGVVLTLDPSPISPFANRISQITLPARWSAGISSTDAETVEVNPVPGGLVLLVGEREFAYSRKGLAVLP
ncbi:MAG: CRISPR-associated helicase Cas3' [Deltaproteobacteria bacterium]|nr:CRISPR-associated helicase Cas3' [Deltaproteobacteria bacterium]